MRLVIVSALMVATKMLEVQFLELDFCAQNLMGGLFSREQVVECEEQIVKLCQWDLVQESLWDALAFLSSMLSEGISYRQEQIHLTPVMSEFLSQALVRETYKDLCVLTCLPRYFATDKLSAVAALVSQRIHEFRNTVRKQGDYALQCEYGKVVVYWSHLCQNFLGRGTYDVMDLGRKMVFDLEQVKKNMKDRFPYMLA